MAYAEKQMTDRQLQALCRKEDARIAKETRADLDRLIRAMNHKKFRFTTAELTTVQAIIHGAYGRMILGN